MFRRLVKLHGDLEAVCRNTALYAQVALDWQMRLTVRHRWNVTTAEAREIQQKLRENWEGSDRLGTIRNVAGLDAAFVVKGSQAFRKPSRWNALREANRAIGAAVLFNYPEMC